MKVSQSPFHKTLENGHATTHTSHYHNLYNHGTQLHDYHTCVHSQHMHRHNYHSTNSIDHRNIAQFDDNQHEMMMKDYYNHNQDKMTPDQIRQLNLKTFPY